MRTIEQNIHYALERIAKGDRYGSDMRSSSVVCYQDAGSLLRDAMESLVNRHITCKDNG